MELNKKLEIKAERAVAREMQSMADAENAAAQSLIDEADKTQKEIDAFDAANAVPTESVTALDATATNTDTVTADLPSPDASIPLVVQSSIPTQDFNVSPLDNPPVVVEALVPAVVPELPVEPPLEEAPLETVLVEPVPALVSDQAPVDSVPATVADTTPALVEEGAPVEPVFPTPFVADASPAPTEFIPGATDPFKAVPTEPFVPTPVATDPAVDNSGTSFPNVSPDSTPTA